MKKETKRRWTKDLQYYEYKIDDFLSSFIGEKINDKLVSEIEDGIYDIIEDYRISRNIPDITGFKIIQDYSNIYIETWILQEEFDKLPKETQEEMIGLFNVKLTYRGSE